MTACGTDYLTQDWNTKSYILAYAVGVYFIPLFTIIWAYSHIVKVNKFIMKVIQPKNGGIRTTQSYTGSRMWSLKTENWLNGLQTGRHSDS